MRRDVPHIEKREEGKRRERGGEKESRKRKSFRLEGSPSVKQKKGSDTPRDSGKAACRGGRGSYLYHPRRARCKKRSVGERKDGGEGGGEGEKRDHIFAADYDSFNVKLERVMQRDGNFYSPCLPGYRE